MKLQNAKGTRDYMPEEMIVINRIMNQLKVSFEKAGYNPLSTPLVERFDVLSAKYAGGSEILKETFKLTDQGNRELGLRYDLTVPFARVVGSNPQLKFPFKRYQMEKVYRDGPIGAGRYREFWQCDIDVVGSKSMKAEAELLSIVEDFFLNLELDAIIKVNNRKIMSSILDYFKVENKDPVIMIIDKFSKLRKESLIQELVELGYEQEESEEIIGTFVSLSVSENENLAKENERRLSECEKLVKTDEGKEGLLEVRELLDLCNAYGLQRVCFEPILARGLSYYTGTVTEVVLENNKITSTVCAGGRYDKLIQNLLESKEEYPTVGLSFGLSRVFDALVADDKVKAQKTVSDVFVYSMGEDVETIKIVRQLRDAGINAELDLMNRKPGKNMKYAGAMDIPFIIAIGSNEVENRTVSLKSKEGREDLTIEEAIDIIKGFK